MEELLEKVKECLYMGGYRWSVGRRWIENDFRKK